MYPNFNKSTGFPIQVKVTLVLSDVPVTQQDRGEYFYNLNLAIQSTLSISMEWHINITQIENYPFEAGRRLGLSSNSLVMIVITSVSASSDDAVALQNKLDSNEFVDQLNSLGFKASKSKSLLTSTSNQALSPIAVGLCSAAGVLTGFTVLFCLAKKFCYSASDRFEMDKKSGTDLDDNCIAYKFNKSQDLYKESAVGEISDSNHGINLTEQDSTEQVALKHLCKFEYSKSEMSADSCDISSDTSHIHVLQLLKKCELEPSCLIQKESRKQLEDKLVNQKSPLLDEHLAVLQLISKAEIDSDLSMDSVRKQLLEKRVKEGPLTADHLLSAMDFVHGKVDDLCQIDPAEPAETTTIANASPGQIKTGYNVKQLKNCDDFNALGNLGSNMSVNLVSTGFYTGMCEISRLEVGSSLLSREERSQPTLQLIELRAKIAKFRRSFPEWVMNGLQPPKPNTTPSLAADILNQAESTGCPDLHPDRNAEQICCYVQADIVFPDFMPQEMQKYVDVPAESPQSISDSIAAPEPLAGCVFSLRPFTTPQSRTASSLPGMSCKCSHCLSNCLQAVLGLCSSGLDIIMRR